MHCLIIISYIMQGLGAVQPKALEIPVYVHLEI